MVRGILWVCRQATWSIPTMVLAVSLALIGVSSTASMRAQGAATVMVIQNATLNQQILTDANGMTLYVFARDASGVSNCSGGCASTWPPAGPGAGTPVLDSSASGALSVISRSDNSQQLAYNGMPLYTYSGDKNPGDTSGQGIGGVWSAATP